MKIEGKLLVRNIVLNFIGQAIPLIVAVVTVPFIVRGLGTERFGLLSLAWVVLSYFAIFDLGLGRATTKFVAEALGKGEEEQVPRLVWTAVTVQAILGILGAIVLVGITPILVEHLLKTSPALLSEAKATFYLLALAIPVVLVYSSFSGVLEAKQRFDLVNAVRIPSNITVFILPIVGLLLGFNLPGIVALILLARFGALVAFVLMNFRTTPQLRRYSGSFALFPRLFSFGGWVMVSSIVSPIFTYLERFLIASFLSVSALTFYAVPYEITSRVVIIPASISATLFPAFSYYWTGDYSRVKELFSRPFKYILFGMVPILVIFVAFGSEILNLWVGKEFAQKSTIVLQILALTFFFNALAYVPFSSIQGLGRPDLKAKLDLIMLPTYVGLCWWLIPNLGLVGVALAKLLIAVIDVSYLSVRAKGLAELTIKEMFGERACKAIIIAGFFALTVFYSKMLHKALLVDITVLSGLIFVYIFLFIKIVMDDKDKLAIQSVQKYFLLGRRRA